MIWVKDSVEERLQKEKEMNGAEWIAEFDDGIALNLQKRFSKERVKGKFQFMCKKCFHLTEANINLSYLLTTDSMEPIFLGYGAYTERCKGCGQEAGLIMLDYNIAKAIQYLNVKGYETENCCEGHGKEEPYIIFKNNNIEEKLHTLPITWEVTDFRADKSRICAPVNDWMEAIHDITIWAKGL